MPGLLLIIPAYNEEESLEKTVSRLLEVCPEIRFVIVNDGSIDATAEICRKNSFPLLDLPVNTGLAGAFRAGVLYAESRGYDYVLQYDADGQHLPEYIEPMRKAAEEGNDVVIASRWIDRKMPYSLRMLGSRLISGAIRLTTGRKIKDPTSGMRLYSRNVFPVFTANDGYEPEPDTISMLLRQGVRVCEIPAEMQERESGQSYLSFTRSVSYMARVLFSILLFQAFRNRPPIRRGSDPETH